MSLFCCDKHISYLLMASSDDCLKALIVFISRFVCWIFDFSSNCFNNYMTILTMIA